MSTAFYSVIQFCPDAARQEAVNVGVILFDIESGYVDVKFTPTLDRIRKFFGNVIDATQLKSLGESVRRLPEQHAHLFMSVDSFREMGARQANELRFTPPRKIALGHAQTVLDSVYRRLVESAQSKAKVGRLETRLREEFGKPDLNRRIHRSIEVTVAQYPQPIRAPFGYQNGVFNLIQPVTFQADDAAQLLRQTGGLHLEGELLRETKHPKLGRLGLVVVGDVKGDKKRAVERFISEKLSEENVTFYSAERLDDLFEEIRNNGKEFSSTSSLPLVDESADKN